jgi:hypothetical protein
MTDTLPTNVRIREVGPRDGFQNEPEVIPTPDKVRLIDRLARTGVKRLEATSFVRPDVIPQLADAREVLYEIDVPGDVAVSVLIPNERGLDHALEVRERFQEINVFLSASETHNRKNVNRSIEESLSGLETVLGRAREAGLRCEAVISVSFGCPYEGDVPEERVFSIAQRLCDAGAQEIGFGDTTGMANPRQVRGFFAHAREALSDSSIERLTFLRLWVSVALRKTLISWKRSRRRSAFSSPFSFGISTEIATSSGGSMRSSTSSASASCGMTSARTKLVASRRRTPVRASRSISRTFSSVGTTSGSFWKPSRGPTSRMRTEAG